MATLPTIKPITAADIERLDNEKAVEIVHGDWVERPLAGELHGAIETNLVMGMGGFVKAHKLGRVFTGDTTFVLEGTPDNIITMRMPDVAFVAADYVKNEDRAGFYFQAPDLAIEIVSPSEKTVDTQAKVNDYLRTGSRVVWVIYPNTRQVSVVQRGGTAAIYSVGQTIPGGELLPGFSIEVATIFDV